MYPTIQSNPQLAPRAEYDSDESWYAYLRTEQAKTMRSERRKDLVVGWLFVLSVLSIPSVVAYLIFIRVVH